VVGSQNAEQKRHISKIYHEQDQFSKSQVQSEDPKSLHHIPGENERKHNIAILKNYTY